MTTTLTDLFCGAGGSSTGAEMVPGIEVVMAANHWALAIETHQANHPNTAHDCADISQVDPRRYPTTDILWASPSCTNHSIAKGISRQRQDEARRRDLLGLLEAGKPLSDDAAMRSRATMWDVVRFAEHHLYRAIIVENVIDAAEWVLFPAWRAALVALGYRMRLLSLNSMHASSAGLPAPQSRDRLYVILWRKGDKAPDVEHVIRPQAWCPKHGWIQAMQAFKNPHRKVGRYRSQYTYRCPQVSCRNHVVEPPTIPAASIIDWTDLGERIGDRSRPLAAKTLARIQTGINRYWTGTWQPPTTPIPEAWNTKTSSSSTDPRAPFIAELRGGGSTARPVTAPLATVTASGNHHALITPYYGTQKGAVPARRPLPTVTTRDRHGIAVAPKGLLMRNNGGTHGSAHLTTPTEEPARTITTAGHQSLLTGGTVNIDDVHFRMLNSHEITRAMAFPSDYIIRGNRGEKVKQAGNAVTPPAARDIIKIVAEVMSAI